MPPGLKKKKQNVLQLFDGKITYFIGNRTKTGCFVATKVKFNSARKAIYLLLACDVGKKDHFQVANFACLDEHLAEMDNFPEKICGSPNLTQTKVLKNFTNQ